MNTMHLLGAEAVESAARTMSAAADKMKEAARDMDFALTNHQRFLNDWLDRLNIALEEMIPDADTVHKVSLVRDEDEEEGRPTERPPAETKVLT